MRKRLRKKLRVGEFQELGFHVRFQIADWSSDDTCDFFGLRLVPRLGLAARQQSIPSGRFAWARSKIFRSQRNGSSIGAVVIDQPTFGRFGSTQGEELLSTEPVRLFSP
jgi:hypothetical protein